MALELYAVDHDGSHPLGTYEGKELYEAFLTEYLYGYDAPEVPTARYRDAGSTQSTQDIIYHMHKNTDGSHEGFIAIADDSVAYGPDDHYLDISQPLSGQGRYVMQIGTD